MISLSINFLNIWKKEINRWNISFASRAMCSKMHKTTGLKRCGAGFVKNEIKKIVTFA